MEQWNTLRKLAAAAGTVRDIAFESRTYEFPVPQPLTLYLDAGPAHVTLQRTLEPRIIVDIRLQAGFGWRLIHEQDEAGVYIVARRRAIVGPIARAEFMVSVPDNIDTVLKVENGQVTLNDISGMYELPANAWLHQLSEQSDK